MLDPDLPAELYRQSAASGFLAVVGSWELKFSPYSIQLSPDGGLCPFSLFTVTVNCPFPFLYIENFYLAFMPNVNVTSSRKPAWTLPNGISFGPRPVLL